MKKQYVVIIICLLTVLSVPQTVFASQTSQPHSFFSSVTQKVTSFFASIFDSKPANTTPAPNTHGLVKRIEKLEQNTKVLSGKTSAKTQTKQSPYSPPTPTQTPQATTVLNPWSSFLSNISTGILHVSGTGIVTSSFINLSSEVSNTLPVTAGGTGGSFFNQYGIVYGNGSDGLNSLSAGNAGYVLTSSGSGDAPTWSPLPSASSNFNTLNVGNNTPFTIDNNGKVTLSYVGDAGYLSSNGGAVFLNNSNNIGTGLGIYSNAGTEALGNMINIKVDNPDYAQAAFYMNYDGSSNAVEIINNGSDTSSNALSITNNNIYDSSLGVIGNELNRGTLKVTHYRPSGGTDSSASGISIDLRGAGTRAQGLYIDSTEAGGTLGDLLRLRNTSIDKFVVDYQGNLTMSGNVSQGEYGTDTSWTKYGNTTGDQFFVGSNGSFRVQRAASNSEAFRVQISGDTQGRWRGTSDGRLQWGDGANAQDITIQRGAVGMLWLTGGMVFNNSNGSYNTVVKGVTDSNLLYVNASSDRIGIGTSTPTSPLHINKNSANAGLLINQLGTGNIISASDSGSTVFTLDRTGNVRTVGSLCVKATITSSCAGNTAGNIYASNTTVQAADVAENYISAQKLEPGDVVMPATDNNQAVIKTTQAYQSQTIGIVSTKPGVTLNSDAQTDAAHPYLVPIALSGRVPIKVTSANGTIKAGDLLSPGTIPGVAMKGNKRGTIVAKALEGYTNTDPQAVGKIMAFVSVSYHDNEPVAENKQEATSSASQKIGDVMLPAGATEVEIKVSQAPDNAKLFVEPEETPVATAVKRRAADTFLIKIAIPQSSEIKLHWWLVN